MKKTTKEIVHKNEEADKTIGSIFHFARFVTEFSKWISVIFVFIFVTTWAAGWVVYIMTGNYPTGILQFVLDPTMTILSFYFGTKMVENVVKIVGGYWLNKQNIAVKPISLNDSSGGYGFDDDYFGSTSLNETTVLSEPIAEDGEGMGEDPV